MKLTSKDFSAMKMPAIALVIAIAASAVMVWFTLNQLARAEKQVRSQLASLQEAKTRFQRSGEERETVMHYIQAYRQLERVGFVGAEQRLNWVEALRKANVQAGLFGVDYQLSAQQRFPGLGQGSAVGDRIKHSEMKLSFGVLHEGSLMRFLSDLSAQQSGYFVVTACSLDRTGWQGPPQPKQPNLRAECDLSWLTIAPEKDTR
jgi:hypothetical protein